jgi:hypothetical protein
MRDDMRGAAVGILVACLMLMSGEPCEALDRTGIDWTGLGRDTGYVLGYEVAVGVPLYLATQPYHRDWFHNVRNPRWDGDAFWLNYIAHPYWGATYWVRARERGADRIGAFVYSALLSTMFEFGVEALFEPPSYNDLIVTPVAGALIGAFIFEPLRERIKAKAERAWYDDVILVATDPIGAANSVVEWALGVTPNLQLQMRPPRAIPTARPQMTGVPAHGVSFAATFAF